MFRLLTSEEKIIKKRNLPPTEFCISRNSFCSVDRHNAIVQNSLVMPSLFAALMLAFCISIIVYKVYSQFEQPFVFHANVFHFYPLLTS